jgi:uncharacterized membrane protein
MPVRRYFTPREPARLGVIWQMGSAMVAGAGDAR